MRWPRGAARVCRPAPQAQHAHGSHALHTHTVPANRQSAHALLCEHGGAGMGKDGLLRVDIETLLLTAAITTAKQLLRRLTHHQQSPSWRADTEMASVVRVFGEAARLHLCRRAFTFASFDLILPPLTSMLTRLSSNLSGQY